MAHLMTDAISPFPPLTASHTHSLSLSVSPLSCSLPLHLHFDIKMLSDSFRLSMNKQILLRTVLISKGSINTKVDIKDEPEDDEKICKSALRKPKI